MQDAGAVAGAGHARIGDAHHVAHAGLKELLWDRQLAPFGHARRAHGPGILEHQHRIRRDIQIRVVDPRVQVGPVGEDHRRAGVLEQ